MSKQKFLPLVLFLLAFFSAGLTHLVNHKYLSELSSEVLREQTTVLTSDDASYLAPAENFLAGNGWKGNAAGKAAIASRSPGYGLLYSLFSFVLSIQTALVALVIFQLFLFATAVALIPQIGAFLKLGKKLSLAIALSVAILPTFSGFLSYTLTEAITPSIVLIFLYGLFRFNQNKQRWLIPLSLLLGILILVRPPMIIWIFSVLIVAVYHFREMRFGKLVTMATLSLVPIFVWQVFISIKTGQVQSFHPIYQSDNNDLYRPLHDDIWSFQKSWGQTGPAFNATVNQLWTDALQDNDAEKTISTILAATDQDAVRLIGEDRLRNAYLTYLGVLEDQVPYALKNSPINGYLTNEQELSETFVQFRKEYIHEYWFYSNVVIPLKVYSILAAHSNLSLYIFQKPWRGNVFMELLRYFSFFIHFGVFICFPFALLITRKSVLWLSISIPVLVYLGYLCIVQRGVEERYTLPVLVPMLLVVAGGAQELFVRLKLYYQTRTIT